MIQGNSTIGKDSVKHMLYCFQAMYWSSNLKPLETLEDAIELIIEMYLQLREAKIVYHLQIILAINISVKNVRY